MGRDVAPPEAGMPEASPMADGPVLCIRPPGIFMDRIGMLGQHAHLACAGRHSGKGTDGT